MGQDQGPGWVQVGSWPHHLFLHPAPAAHPCSAATLPPPCPSSTTTGPGLAAATRPGPRAPPVSALGASAPAGPMSSAVTAPAVPLATGASPAADVSAQGWGLSLDPQGPSRCSRGAGDTGMVARRAPGAWRPCCHLLSVHLQHTHAHLQGCPEVAGSGRGLQPLALDMGIAVPVCQKLPRCRPQEGRTRTVLEWGRGVSWLCPLQPATVAPACVMSSPASASAPHARFPLTAWSASPRPSAATHWSAARSVTAQGPASRSSPTPPVTWTVASASEPGTGPPRPRVVLGQE